MLQDSTPAHLSCKANRKDRIRWVIDGVVSNGASLYSLDKDEAGPGEVEVSLEWESTVVAGLRIGTPVSKTSSTTTD